MNSDPAIKVDGPMILRPLQDYQDFLEEGRFMLQRARGSKRFFFYPRVAEPETGSRDLEWVEVSGQGVVHAVTVISQRPPTPNYNVALIDLEEGPRMMSRIDGLASEDIQIGMSVRAKIIRENDLAVVVFEPARDQE